MTDNSHLQIHGPDGAITRDVRARLRNRLDFCSNCRLEAVLTHEGRGWKVRVSAHPDAGGAAVTAHAIHDQLTIAIDTCAARLRTQLRARHERHSHHAATPMGEASA